MLGAFAYTLPGYGVEYGGNHLYQFADVLTNFTSLLMFVIIATTILGALLNRRHNKVKVTRSRGFVPAAIIALVINYFAAAYMIIASIVDMAGYNGADQKVATIKFIIFIAILAISIVPALITTRNKK